MKTELSKFQEGFNKIFELNILLVNQMHFSKPYPRFPELNRTDEIKSTK